MAQENYSVNTDEPPLTLTDLTNIKIILEIPEYEVEDIEIDQKVEIKPELFEQKKSYEGHISRVSKISKTSKNTTENVLEEREISYSALKGNKIHITSGIKEGEKYILFPTEDLVEGMKINS